MYFSLIILIFIFTRTAEPLLLTDDEFNQSSLFDDYIFILTNNLQWTPKNVILRIYLSSSTDSVTGSIIEHFCSLSDKRSTIISTTDGNFMSESMSEKIGMAIANDEQDLKVVLSLLYERAQHDYSVICITYPISNVAQNLTVITSRIWTKGLSRNVLFIAISRTKNAVVILRAPTYQQGQCDDGQLVEVGYVKNKNYTLLKNNYLPKFDDLGGCELNIMVQPPLMPYIESRSSSPGGFVGMLVDVLSEKLNFTPKYSWAFGRIRPLKHYNANNLNVLFDLLPRSLIPVHKYSFNFGLVKSGFVVPHSKHFSDSTNLLNPFDYVVWICLAIALACLTWLTYLKTRRDFVHIFMQFYGVLLGVGSPVPNSKYRKMAWCLWLLPAFILQQSYLASLVKNMAFTRPLGDINTLSELIDSKMNVACTSDMRMHFCRSISSDHMEYFYLCLLCEEVDDKYIFKKLYPAAMAGKVLNNTAFLANQEIISFTEGNRKVRFVSESFISVPQMVTVRPGNPYIFEVYKLYARCVESGLFEYWIRRNKPIIRYKTKITFVDVVNDKLRNCFYIIFTGWTIGVLVLIVEIFLHNKLYKTIK